MLFKNKICENCSNPYDPVLEDCPHCKVKNQDFDRLGIPKSIFWLRWPYQLAMFLTGFSFVGMTILEVFLMVIFGFISEEILRNFTVIATTYCVLFAIMCVFLSFNWKQLFKFFKNWESYLFGIVFALLLYGGGIIINILMSPLAVETNANQSLINTYLAWYPVPSILVMGIIGPIVEECTYRIGLFSLLRRLNKWAAYAITIFLFTIIHFDFDPKTIVNELLNLPSYILAGAVFCVAYDLKGPVCSSFAHIVYNTASLVLIMTLG